VQKTRKEKTEKQRKILPYSPSSTSIDLAEAADHADNFSSSHSIFLPHEEEIFLPFRSVHQKPCDSVSFVLI
jgi:hypothetical protein